MFQILLLLITSINLYGQNNTIPLKGFNDSLVVVDIATIKEATIKLIERGHLKEIVKQQDTIIINQKQIISNYVSENLYLVNKNSDLVNDIEKERKLNNKLNKNIKRYKTSLYICGGITIGCIGTVILRSLINGK